MALKLKYYHSRHKVEYPEAYAKLTEGKFDSKELHILVSVYPSSISRETLKARENLEKKLNSASVAIKEKQDAMLKVQQTATEAYDALEKVKFDFKEGKAKQDIVDKAQEDLDKKSLDASKASEDFLKTRYIAEQIQAGLDSDPIAEPVDTLKFSFPITEELLASGNIFSVAYNKLKDTEIFKEAEDV